MQQDEDAEPVSKPRCLDGERSQALASSGFRLQLADGREKRFGLGQVEAGEAKVWPTPGLVAAGHGTNGARSNWSQALPQEQVPVLASPDTPR